MELYYPRMDGDDFSSNNRTRTIDSINEPYDGRASPSLFQFQNELCPASRVNAVRKMNEKKEAVAAAKKQKNKKNGKISHIKDFLEHHKIIAAAGSAVIAALIIVILVALFEKKKKNRY